jgi:dihydrofolate reductase
MGLIIAAVDMTLDGYYDRMDEWFDDEDEQRVRVSDELIRAAEAVIIGRETYEALSKFWSARDDEFSTRVNELPKYVASRTLTGKLDWNATLLDGPVEEVVPALKEQHHLMVSWGFGELGATLIEHDLLDELRVGIHPFIAGSGEMKLSSSPFRLHTLQVTAISTGAIMASYRPAR